MPLEIRGTTCYGRLGFEYHWLYDPLAMYRVTVNGQLFLLMLIERMEEGGFEVFYANTDGITVKVPNEREEEFRSICKEWEEELDYVLEYDEFERFIINNVNNYIVLKKGASECEQTYDALKNAGLLKLKGSMDPYQYKDLMKSYWAPIIPLAVFNYLVFGTSPKKTIESCKDVLDFCLAQKFGSGYDAYFEYVEEDMLKTRQLQKTNRFIISTKGGSIYKYNGKRKISLVTGKNMLLVNDLEKFNTKYPDPPVDYSWYIEEAYKIIHEIEPEQLTLF